MADLGYRQNGFATAWTANVVYLPLLIRYERCGSFARSGLE
jgi:hypothetical protein